jgi:HSP20 family molecular chaperone IbpA
MSQQTPTTIERGTRSYRERARPERVMPMDAYLVADRLIVHVDLLDADPRTASVSLDGDVVSVTAVHRSGDRAGAWYAQSVALDRALEPDCVQARVHDGVVTVTVDLRGGEDRSSRSARR